MKTVVVDASVAIKWFVPEIHSADAARLLTDDLKLMAPDLIFAEVGNILWKKQRSKELSSKIANEILHDLKRLPIDTYKMEPLLETALQIACKHQCTVYDSLYVALAQQEKSVVATADSSLCNALKNTSLAKLLLWVENI